MEILPPEAVAVNAGLAIHHDGDRTVYYHFLIPVHAHPRDDERARNRIVSQLVCLRAATVAELAAALGLSERTIRRAVAARREQGEAAFDGERGRGGLSALTEPAPLQEAADLLAAGRSLREVAAALDVSHGTVRNYRERGLLPPPRSANGIRLVGGPYISPLARLGSRSERHVFLLDRQRSSGRRVSRG